MMQQRTIQREHDETYDRELVALMEACKRAKQALGLDTDKGSDEMDTGDEGRREFIREDTEPVEDMDVGPSHTPRLGPHGTELIDHSSFAPEFNEVLVYPEAWVAARKMVRWQPTEEFIS